MLRVGWGMKGTKTRLELGGTARAGLGGLGDAEGALDVRCNHALSPWPPMALRARRRWLWAQQVYLPALVPVDLLPHGQGGFPSLAWLGLSLMGMGSTPGLQKEKGLQGKGSTSDASVSRPYALDCPDLVFLLLPLSIHSKCVNK